MNITNLVFIFLLGGHAFAGARWKSFCERYLVADDPYQYESLTVDQLADVYLAQFNSGINTKTIVNEILSRTKSELSYEDREILTKLLNYERRK